MTAPEQNLPDPRRSVFAVWHWPRWVWCVVLPLMTMAYLLSPPVVEHMRYYFRISARGPIGIAARGIYHPALWCGQNVEIVGTAQTRIRRSLFTKAFSERITRRIEDNVAKAQKKKRKKLDQLLKIERDQRPRSPSTTF